MWGARQVLLVIFCLWLQWYNWYNEWECEGSQDCIVMGEMILIERQSWLFWCKYLCDVALSGLASNWVQSERPISCIRLKGQMSSLQTQYQSWHWDREIFSLQINRLSQCSVQVSLDAPEGLGLLLSPLTRGGRGGIASLLQMAAIKDAEL